MILRMGYDAPPAYSAEHPSRGGQLATTPQFKGARWMPSPESGTELLRFASTCPRCRREQSQCGFSRATLLRLLDDDLEIHAYCASCRDFWPISEEERSRIIGEFDDYG